MQLALSLVVPLFNEEENLEELDRRVRRALAGRTYEVIYVDDGSTDETWPILERLAVEHPQLRAVRFRRNYGQTAALSAGLEAARAPVVVTMDGDLQNDPEDIPGLLEVLEQGYDLVCGWRRERRDPLLRRAGSRLANWLINRLFGLRIHDLGCTLRAYRAELAHELALYGELHRFIPILASMEGARIAEVVVRHHPRRGGRSKYGALSRAPRVFMDLVVLAFLRSYLDRPFHIFGALGLGMALVGVVIDAWLSLEKLLRGAEIGGRPLLLLGTLLILTGVQLFSLGLLAEVEVRTYFESQRRPVYRVRQRLR